MRPLIKFHTTLNVSSALMGLTLGVFGAVAAAPHAKQLDVLSISIEPASEGSVSGTSESVQWDGREFDVESGIRVLVGVIRDPAEGGKDRELALIQLAMLRTQLKGHQCLNELESVYITAGDLEKQLILTCFLGARDPRGIRVFTRSLEIEDSMKLRLAAASGLAGWNIRRGVQEIVDLLESGETLPKPTRIPFVRDNALECFRHANTRKGWGFPDDEVRTAITAQPGLDREDVVNSYVAEIKKWFAANKHRFPEWKPGVPLPKSAEAKPPHSSEK